MASAMRLLKTGSCRVSSCDDSKGPPFRTIGRGAGKLTRSVLPQPPGSPPISRKTIARNHGPLYLIEADPHRAGVTELCRARRGVVRHRPCFSSVPPFLCAYQFSLGVRPHARAARACLLDMM